MRTYENGIDSTEAVFGVIEDDFAFAIVCSARHDAMEIAAEHTAWLQLRSAESLSDGRVDMAYWLSSRQRTFAERNRQFFLSHSATPFSKFMLWVNQMCVGFGYRFGRISNYLRYGS